MTQFPQQFSNWYKRYQKNKQYCKELFKNKSDILLLNKKVDSTENAKWPCKISLSKRERDNLYTTDTIHKKRKPNRRCRTLPYDPVSKIPGDYFHSKRIPCDPFNSRDSVDLSIDHFLTHDSKPKPTKELDQDTTALIKDLSMDLLDNVLINISNTRTPEQDNNKEKVDLDWEFIIGNLIQLELPPSVIDRVKRRMALITGKNTPAITAMNVTRPLLSDLTITTAEVKMNQEIQDLLKKNETFKSENGDEPFENSVKWLINLDKKDQSSKDKEIENIHQDYTNHVLDLKPAFF